MYWLETQLCLPGTRQVHKNFAYAVLISFYSWTYKSASNLYRTGISFVLDCLLSEHLAIVLGNPVEHNSAGNYELVLDPTTFHLHKKSSHGSSSLVCSGLEGYCFA